MTAYNAASLDRLLVCQETQEAFDNKLISRTEFDAVQAAYTPQLYMPNVFIRIGLFVLTYVILSMCFGMFCLMIQTSSKASLGAASLFFSLLSFGAAEFAARKGKHYHSGLDTALLWSGAGLSVVALNLMFDFPAPLVQATLIFLLSLYGTIRFVNATMSAVAFLALLAVIFYITIPFGFVAKAIMPFLLMTFSLVFYFIVYSNRKRNSLRHYQSVLTTLQVLPLITSYAAVNFFIVREVSNQMFDLNLRQGESIPGGIIFWLTTSVIPVVYLLRGIQKRSAIQLRVGLVTLCATAVTVKHYYSVIPLDVSMTLAGVIMIVLSYYVTKYLGDSRHGITHKEPNDPRLPGMLQLEALAVADAFRPVPVATQDKHFDFGGGSGGGAGATGEF